VRRGAAKKSFEVTSTSNPGRKKSRPLPKFDRLDVQSAAQQAVPPAARWYFTGTVAATDSCAGQQRPTLRRRFAVSSCAATNVSAAAPRLPSGRGRCCLVVCSPPAPSLWRSRCLVCPSCHCTRCETASAPGERWAQRLCSPEGRCRGGQPPSAMADYFRLSGAPPPIGRRGRQQLEPPPRLPPTRRFRPARTSSPPRLTELHWLAEGASVMKSSRCEAAN